MDFETTIKDLHNRINKLEAENAILIEQNKTLERVAFMDQLTGALNRNYLDMVIKEKYAKTNCYVCFVDLNNLKVTNDTLGHDEGDKLIKDISSKLSNIGTSIRLGGDEFLLIIEKSEQENLSNFISLAKENNNYALGIVEKVEEESFSSAMKRADSLMYLDKQRIKDGKTVDVSFYPPKPGEIPFSVPLDKLGIDLRGVVLEQQHDPNNLAYSCIDDPIWRNWSVRKQAGKTHTLNLNPHYFELMKRGEKVYEGRLNDDKRKTFNIGDEIVFYKEPERIENFKATILDKEFFENFDNMASVVDKTQLGFKGKTKDEIVATYRSFYSAEDEKKYGVVVFKIKLDS